eukprot:6204241-Pleurochrysis_carterae.AAC.3
MYNLNRSSWQRHLLRRSRRNAQKLGLYVDCMIFGHWHMRAKLSNTYILSSAITFAAPAANVIADDSAG